MSQVFKRGPAKPKMNITPLIDVTFQLIVFFMLVNTIASEQIIQLVLPDLSNPNTIKLEDGNRLIVNVGTREYTSAERGRGKNVLTWPGEAARIRIGNSNFDIGDIGGMANLMTERNEQNPELRILLRGDAALYYDQMRPVMRAIADARIRTLNMVAYMNEQ